MKKVTSIIISGVCAVIFLVGDVFLRRQANIEIGNIVRLISKKKEEQ